MRNCLKQARAQVPPEDYLFVLIDHGETFHCPAVNSNSDAGQITLGDAFMQSYYIDFDRTKGRMGFAPANIDNCGGNTNCGTLHAPASTAVLAAAACCRCLPLLLLLLLPLLLPLACCFRPRPAASSLLVEESTKTGVDWPESGRMRAG